jgi:sugar phosphate isomerase/epimerase
MRVFGGQIPKGATEQQAIAWAVEVLKRGAEYAGSRGITLGVEDDGGLTTAAGPTVEIVKQTASQWAGINADSGNLRVDGYSQFAMMLPYTTSVHLKGSIAGEDGTKENADWKRLTTMIGQSGYKGYVGLEYEGNDATNEVPRQAATLRALLRIVSA